MLLKNYIFILISLIYVYSVKAVSHYTCSVECRGFYVKKGRHEVMCGNKRCGNDEDNAREICRYFLYPKIPELTYYDAAASMVSGSKNWYRPYDEICIDLQGRIDPCFDIADFL